MKKDQSSNSTLSDLMQTEIPLYKIQDYVESRCIEGFDWNDFHLFLKASSSEPQPPQTFDLRFQTYPIVDLPTDTWSLDDTQLDAGRLGMFEEYPSWRNYYTPLERYSSRSYFRFADDECHKLTCYLDSSGKVVSAEYRKCVNWVSEQDLRPKILCVWESLVWTLQYKAHVFAHK